MWIFQILSYLYDENIYKFVINGGDFLADRSHGDKVLKSSDKYSISLEVDQKLYYLARLEIKNVQAADKGEYRIAAKNTLGEAKSHVQLNFLDDQGRPKWVSVEFSN